MPSEPVRAPWEIHSRPDPQTRPDAPPATCRAEYERDGGHQPGDRIVRCQLSCGHPGDHEETDTESHWPRDEYEASCRCGRHVQVDAPPATRDERSYSQQFALNAHNLSSLETPATREELRERAARATCYMECAGDVAPDEHWDYHVNTADAVLAVLPDHDAECKRVWDQYPKAIEWLLATEAKLAELQRATRGTAEQAIGLYQESLETRSDVADEDQAKAKALNEINEGAQVALDGEQ